MKQLTSGETVVYSCRSSLITHRLSTFFLPLFLLWGLSSEVWSSDENALLLPNDGQAGDSYGYSVSVSGNRAIIGAYGDNPNGPNGNYSGSAYVYERDAVTGEWVEVQKLTASDGAAWDQYGYSVSISGDWAVIGAYGDQEWGLNSGSAYMYKRDTTTGDWNELDKLTASDGEINDQFGFSVSISDGRTVIGAHRGDDNGLDSGSAYVFELDPANDTWSEIQKLAASDGEPADQFGYSVSISGDRAIVGAPLDTDNGVQSGSVYFFDWNGVGSIGHETQKLLASDGEENDFFSHSVSVSDDRAVVGAPGDNDSGTWSGSAYVIERDPATGWWAIVQKLIPSTAAQFDHFGASVSLSGNRTVIGAYGDRYNGLFTGSAFVFELDAQTSTWTEELKLTANDPAVRDNYGESVSISGNHVVIGVPGDKTNGTSSGSARVFELAPQLALTEPTLISPVHNLLGTTETFVWKPNGANVTKWWLYLGSRLGWSDYYYSSAEIPASTLSETVHVIPPTGSPLYVRLLYQVQGDPNWRFIDKQYTASGTALRIVDPVPGGQLAGATDTFSWNDNGATQFLLAAGSSVGAWDYYSSGKINSTYSVTATGLPNDGTSTVYVRLWYRWGFERWLYFDKTFTAGNQ